MCRSAVNDGSCSPWVMCSSSAVRGNQTPPPKRAASRRLTQSIIQEGGGAEVEPGKGTEGQVQRDRSPPGQGGQNRRDVKGHWVDRCDVRLWQVGGDVR